MEQCRLVSRRSAWAWSARWLPGERPGLKPVAQSALELELRLRSSGVLRGADALQCALRERPVLFYYMSGSFFADVADALRVLARRVGKKELRAAPLLVSLLRRAVSSRIAVERDADAVDAVSRFAA